ncbi:MAG: class I SAM-dependent methyltransferase [Bacteroidetes bacterium]|nr:MAG: class I SAM-dependent methyltransferase [Bacteroidota bacterium]
MRCLICGGKSLPLIENLYDDRYGAIGKHTIYVCTDCGFGKTVPGLKKSGIAKFYSRYYPLKSIEASTVKAEAKLIPLWLRWFTGIDHSAHFHIIPKTTVLDIGSGIGASLLEIELMGAKAYGVEPDPNAQRLAKELNLNVYIGFITDNPFPKLQFDYITASQVLEHEPDPRKFLKATYKRLKVNGQVILSFPHLNAVYRKIFGKRWLHWHVPYHLNFFTEKSFRILAQQCGYKVVKMRTITPNIWTYLQLKMLKLIPLEGRVNPIWASPNGNIPRRNIELDFQMKVIYQGMAVLNRIIDLTGWGESFLVFLKKFDE